MNTEDFEKELDEAIEKTQAILDENGMLLNRQQPYQYKALSPRALGVLDALDQWKCCPSAYYGDTPRKVEYFLGYISVKKEDRGALVVGGMLGVVLTDEAWLTNEKLDEMHQNALDVDAAQSETTDWRK